MYKTITWCLATALLVTLAFSLFFRGTTEENEDQKHTSHFEQDYRIYSLDLPTEMAFAEEPVPMSLPDVAQRFNRDLLVNTYWQSNGLLMIQRSHRWFPVIEPILREEGVPDDFKYLSLIESGFQQVKSPAGAVGFWQFLKDAGRERGLEINKEVDERYHVEKATRAACAYLKSSKEKFGSWTMAAASYNRGPNGLAKQVARQRTNNYYDLLLNDETKRYMFRIMAAKTILENHQKYGFNLRDKHLLKPLEFDVVTVDSSIANFVDFAFEQGITYKTLKLFNPWLRENKLTVSVGNSYEIKVPKNTEIWSADKSPIEAWKTN